MREKFVGDITASLVEPLQETFDLSTKDLGTCWVKLSQGNSNAPYIAEKTVHLSGKRQFIIPSEDGALLTAIETMIGNAKEMVCVSSFLIQESRMTDALLEAANRGVGVFVLTAREDDLKRADDDLIDFEREQIKDHIALLDQFAGKVLVRTSECFHAKYILVDPRSADASGIMMTCNATKDPMLGSNIEVVLTLTPSEVRSFFAHFLRGFWNMADHELLEKGELRGVKKESLASISLGNLTLPATVEDVRSLEEQVLNIIRNARRDLILTAWSFDSEAVHAAVLDACQRGVQVTVLTRPHHRTTRVLRDCAQAGAKVFGHPRLHAKCVIADARTGLVMTANMTALGLQTGFETAVPLEGSALDTLKNIIDDWRSVCDWNLMDQVTPAMVNGSILQFSKEGTPLVSRTVIPGEGKSLSAFRPDSCDKILEYSIGRKEIDRIMASDPQKVFRQVTLKQMIIPPHLPEGSKEEIRKDVQFPLFRRGKERYIIVKTWEEVRAAQEPARKLNAKIVVDM